MIASLYGELSLIMTTDSWMHTYLETHSQNTIDG
jgi:hypothetical protein